MNFLMMEALSLIFLMMEALNQNFLTKEELICIFYDGVLKSEFSDNGGVTVTYQLEVSPFDAGVTF